MNHPSLRLGICVALCVVSTAIGCGSDDGSGDADDTDGGADTSGACMPAPAIVTDIDETLTLSDEEFLMQLQDASYDPVMREGASELISGYADRGYRVLYLTARAETLTLSGTGETARDATERWLEEHGFPIDDASTDVVLSESLVSGDSASAYKAAALMEKQADGWAFEYAYGNAVSDITGYADAMIAKDQTFIIGEEAGAMNTVAVEGEGWVDHASTQLPMVDEACP